MAKAVAGGLLSSLPVVLELAMAFKIKNAPLTAAALSCLFFATIGVLAV